MKKAVLALILGISLLVAFGMEAKAQIPKEGTISNTWAYSGTFKVLPMGQERLQMTYEVMALPLSWTDPPLLRRIDPPIKYSGFLTHLVPFGEKKG